MLELTGISKSFSGIKVLKNIDFDVRPGEVHSLCGENGAGKSTLLKVISGIHAYGSYSGNLTFEGITRHFQNTGQSLKCGIRMIFQELSLAPDLKVYENIFLNSELKYGPLQKITSMKQKAADLLSQVGSEDIDPSSITGDLPVGNQQLVEIARALGQNCKLLIFDEPTSALNRRETKILLRLMEKLRQKNLGMIYVSHKLDEIKEISDRITILRNGTKLGSFANETVTTRKIVSMMIGKPLESIFPEKVFPASSTPVLTVKKLSLPHPSNPNHLRLRNISFRLVRGEILGLAGLMGSGRTELLETIYGLQNPTPETEIVIENNPLTNHKPDRSRKFGMALSPENRKQNGLWESDSVQTNMSMGNLRQFTIRGGVLNTLRERKTVKKFLHSLQIITNSLHQEVSSLSGGNQQKVIFSRFLMIRPKILLLDDPTRGVDVGAKSEIYHLISRLAQEGTAIIMTSSEQEELIGLCHRIMVLKTGECHCELSGKINLKELMQYAA